jgi:hypothetical protein
MNGRGAPEMTPIWYEYFDGFIWFNGTSSRQWLTRMESTGHATFFLLDGSNAWKWAQVWGRVVEVADDPQVEEFSRLGSRYGRQVVNSGDRRFVKVEITAVKGRAGTPSDEWDAR